MRTYLFLLLALLGISQAVAAQKGRNGIIASVEAGFPTGEFSRYKMGLGVGAKGLLGVGERGQLTLSTGYTSFKLQGSTDALKIKTSIVPFLAGYRHHLSIFYLEPQIGFGSYSTKLKSEDGDADTTTERSESAFTWAAGAGVNLGALDLGLRYQIGYPGGDIGFFGIHAGYNLLHKKD